MAEANVAVLIDYENVGLDAIQHLLDQLSDVGRVIIRRAYGDWSVQRGKQDQLLELGIEPIHQYHSNKSGKNSSDIRLAIEAVELLYASPIDTFVIVSSDSDFVPLVGKLRSSGKSVIVAGRREATSPTLIKSCDRYIFLDTEKQVAAAPIATRRRATVRRGGPPTDNRAAPSHSADSQSLLLRAMDASMDEEGNVVGSKLYQTMRRIEPSFNFKDQRHKLFTQFLDSHSDVIDVIRPKDGVGDVIVQLSNREQPKSSAVRNGRRGRRTPPSDIEQVSLSQVDIDAAETSRRLRQSARSQSDSNGQRSRQRAAEIVVPEPVAPEPDPVEDTPIIPPSNEPQPQQTVDQAPTTDDDAPADAVPVNWEREVDSVWSNRQTERIAGRTAAMDAAKVLGTTKLSISQYPSLDALLSASTLLQLNWRREGNAIFRK